ncbi:MAG: hemolysin family protein [Anaerolineae bacterium]|nr:hemolysin family protein [Anaerolineae bacterium]MDW8068397.1 hemolysin family protein [Anaerolineae bacterium]
MERTSWAGLAVTLLLVVLHGLLAGIRAAFASVRRGRLRQMADEGAPRAALALRLAEDSSRMLGTLYLGKAFLAALAAALAALTLVAPLARALTTDGLPHPWADGVALLIVIGTLSAFILVPGQLVPEGITAARPEEWAIRFARPLQVLTAILWPLVRLLVWVGNRLAAPFGGLPLSGTTLVTEEEIRTLVDAGEEEGVIEEEEKEMIYSIFELGETMAREVMVPRIDIVAVDVQTPPEEVVRVIAKTGHSRIPVYEGTVDGIVGLVYAKDLLLHLQGEGPRPPLREILRPAYFVPETKKVNDLLREMQQRRIHMAIVVDEYGGTAGLVTVEDILEEIVGEIQDEYDIEEPSFEQVRDGEYILDARMNLDDVNDLLEASLPTGAADTLGGLIYDALGRVPIPGDHLQIGEWRIEVLTVSGRRIRKVRMTREK